MSRFQILHFKNFANDLAQKLCKLPISCVLSPLPGLCPSSRRRKQKSSLIYVTSDVRLPPFSCLDDCQSWKQILPMFSVNHEILDCQEVRNCSLKTWILILPSNLFLILSTSFRIKQIACVQSFKTILTTKRWPQAPVSETLQRCQSSKESRNLNSQVLSWL